MEEDAPKAEDCKKNFSEKKINEKREKEKKLNLYNSVLFLIFFIILLLAILFLFRSNKIDNNTLNNEGIIEIINIDKNGKIILKKDIFQNVNQFVSCIGAISSGKSTFSSNYYKKLFNVRNDYFEISNQSTSFTKGIWMISDQERRKIPNYIFKDILDVEGFQFDENKSWKYVMIIAFLSSELIIFNRNEKYDIVGKIIKTIEKGLKKMEKLYIPRMLKVIYIQTIVKKPKETIEKLLENIKYDKNIFKMIKFKFIYLPNVQKS